MQRNSAVSFVTSQPRQSGLLDYQHHIKNLMAVIRSIATRTAENSASMEDFTAHFDGRLAALGRAQRMLARSDAFVTDLEELAREELLSQAGAHPATIEGPGVLLPQKVAEALTLALHELFTNAVEFGALSGQGGSLVLTWRVESSSLVLDWRESGVATMDPQPKRSGFGREWLEHGLAYQTGAHAELAFLPGGLSCTIMLPLNLVALEVAS